jgi:hypothetical protein
VDELSLRILSYLRDNPQATDTLEGIAQWWLFERELRDQVAAVKHSLAGLVADGWLIERCPTGSHAHYGLNPARVGELHALLGKAS